MDVDASRDLFAPFENLTDPRRNNRSHRLTDILIITLLATLSDCDDWVAVALWGHRHEAWLKHDVGLPLPRGIPTHHTFGRLFARLDPDALERCVASFLDNLARQCGGQWVQIDGKRLCGSFDRAASKAGIHMVNAWCHAHSLVLGQLAVEDKSNEITAIPKLLELLELRGARLTIDAMGCQKQIAQTIVDRGADYLLAVKNNHKTLYEDIHLFFQEAIEGQWQGIRCDQVTEVYGDHGRIETRTCWVTSQVAWLERQGHQWAGLKGLVCVQSKRQIKGTSQVTVERRYYIASFDPCELGAEAVLQGTRLHWSVENRLHWSLDVAFREDGSRVRKDHAPQNMARMRRLTLNLLRQMADVKPKTSIRNRRRMCAWHPEVALKTLLAGL